MKTRINPLFIFVSIIFIALSLPHLIFADKGEPLSGEGATASIETASNETDVVGPIHYVLVDGVVNPVMSEYLIKSIDAAVADGAEVVVIQIDTPGGLDLSMRDIIKAILSSDVPVVVYVAPSGSRAASAGVFITYAAHIAAMAPGTNIGSAHPVAMGGGEMDEEMVKKVENDAAAYIMSIAKKRGRNEEWAEQAVRESVNVTSEEALKLGIIDLVVNSRAELLEAIHGTTVELPDGERTIRTEGAVVKQVEMNLRFRILKAITDPNVAYILMMIGVVGLYFELQNPGAILPGVLGAICLILAFYAFQTLSVNYAGLALIGLGILFFIAEVLVTSFGLLAIAGVIALMLGSLMLFDSQLPYLRLSLWVLLPTVGLITAFFLWVMSFAVRIHRRRSVSGMEGLIGELGRAVGALGPEAEGEGKVFVAGEYWNATSEEPVADNDKIKVISVEGLMVKVVRLD